MIEAVRDFLALFDTLPAETNDRLRALAKVLDRLAIAYHDTPDTESDCDNDPPGHETGLSAREPITKAFPDFGLYPVVDPLAEITQPPMMGDGINDLLDIRAEMLEVAWRWENNGPADAQWYFRFSYETHWGRHLVDFRAYLHALQFYG